MYMYIYIYIYIHILMYLYLSCFQKIDALLIVLSPHHTPTVTQIRYIYTYI